MRWNLLALPALVVFAVACGDDGAASEATTNGTNGTNGTNESSATNTESAGSDAGCAAAETGVGTDGASNSLQQTWGAPCTSDEDCVALLGAGGICQDVAVIYELPGGYCTKFCPLPDAMTTVVPDHPDCDPAGGVDCIGAMGTYERCAVPCTDDAQCDRLGYLCVQMPQIAQPTDPKYCLMDECCFETCASDD